MVDLPKGAIIFNHLQTRQLLKNGYVTSRGKMLANGTAHATGNAHVTFYPQETVKSQWKGTGYSNWDDPTYDASDALQDAASSLSDSASDLSDAANDFEEVFDWIEVRLEEIDEKLSLLDAQKENQTYYTGKNNIIDQMIDINYTKMENLAAGVDEYTKYANKFLSEIPEQYRKAAQDGSIAITEFAGETDEATVEAINNYREWAQKAADLAQQLEETKTTIRDLAIEKFNNAYESGEVRTAVEDSQTEKLQNAVDYIEESGRIADEAFYTAMMENSNKKIEYWSNTLVAMQKELDEAVRNGIIERGSNEWYELVDQLYDVQSEIDNATLELEQFQNAINDLYWDNFDELINRIDYLQDETQNLIDLMEKSGDLFVTPEGKTNEGGTIKYWTADDVKWTDEGIATLGLYAQRMEIAEFKARQYAEAIDDLTKEYENGKYSENEYYEKLNELKNAQYESIEAYYDAQDAIVELNKTRIDTVKDGIAKEISAYEELINKKKEELSIQKQAHDFQKQVAEKQKNIADIQKKLAAMAGDTSAATNAERKKLEEELYNANAELQELYYEHSIEKQQDALDEQLDDFQTEKDAEIDKWDEYLENVEQIVADSLNTVQANATGVFNTLSAKADEYNLTLSDAIMEPWKDGALAVSDYQTTFDTSMSSTMDQLAKLKQAWRDVVNEMQRAAAVKVSDINKQNESYVSAEPPASNSTTPSSGKAPSNSAPQAKAIVVGGKINAGSAKIYADSQGGGGGSQYFSSDPIYTVLKEQNGYVQVRWHKLSSGVTGWFKKSDVKAYAKGSKKIDEDQLALIDELGEELVLNAGENGKLQYLSKGSGVVPADLTERLMEWGELDPSKVLAQSKPTVSVPGIINNNFSIDMSIAEVVHIDTVTNDTIPNLEKTIEKQMDSYMGKLNNSLKRYTR